MPPAIIAAVIGAAVSTGTTLYSHFTQPEGPKQPSPAEITNQAVSAETANRAAGVKQAAQFLPQLQSDTSGGLSPDALKDFSATFSGNANLANSPQMQEMVAKFLGIDNGASFGGSSPFGSGGFGSTGLAG